MQSINHLENIVEVKNISFSYGTEEVLRDITFNIHQGDYLGIIGPNGAGKTTLLKIMLGLLKPSTGSVKLFGQAIEKFKDWPRIGYLPQKVTSFDVNFPATVREIVLMGRYGRRGLLRKTTNEDEKIVEDTLRQLDLWDYRDRLIGDLSSGQQQRIFIARAMASQPEVFFLDEPTTGIDQRAQDEFYALLGKFNKEMGLTLVLISHDIERVTREAMHIACIDHTLVCHSSPQEFLAKNQAANLFGQKIIIHQH